MKRQLPMALALLLLAIACVPALASDGEIIMRALGVPNPGGNQDECDYWHMKHRGSSNGNVFGSCRPPVINVYAELQGASAGGITGVEFGAGIGADGGADSGYFLIELPNNTASTVLGTAFFPPDPTPRGQNMSWNVCQTGDGGRVLISTLLVLPTAPCGPSVVAPSLDFSTGQHSSPSNAFFRCPLFTLCDGPVFTKVCLGTDIVDCQTQIPPFPIASKCSTSGGFSINPAAAGSCVKITKAGGQTPSVVDDTRTWSQVKSLYN